MIMIFILAIMFFVIATGVLFSAATTRPLTTTHRLQLQRYISLCVIVMIVCAIAAGFAFERLAP